MMQFTIIVLEVSALKLTTPTHSARLHKTPKHSDITFKTGLVKATHNLAGWAVAAGGRLTGGQGVCVDVVF